MRHLSCILVALAIIGVYADEPEKLVNGRPTTIDNFPHAVSMRMNNRHMCGGSIISPVHILTAAHCLESLKNPSSRRGLTVVSGTTYLNSGGEVHQVADVFSHEQYHPSTYGYDIGIIKLTKPIQFNGRQRPINLPSRDVMKNDPLTIAAWGSMGLGKPIHNDLQKLDSRCIPATECQDYHKGFMRIFAHEFCTLISYQTGNCHGDSGSGIIRGQEIVGCVSRGRPCAVGYPDVYTSVYSFLPWLRQKMAL